MGTWLEDLIDPGAPVTPARTLNANFTPSLVGATLVLYTIELQCTASQTSSVELRSDSAATPTTPRTSAVLTIAATGIATTVRQLLAYVVAAGDNVRLVSAGNGTTPVIAQQVEIPLPGRATA